jgi:hypothetical protein
LGTPGGSEVRPFEAGDESGAVALLGAAFGEWPAGLAGVEPGEFFRWKHDSSPFGPSLRMVAVAEGRIVGFIAWMPWTLRAGDLEVQAMRAVDFAVHPAHRGGDASMALIREGRKRVPAGVAFTWSNPNELSRGRVVSSGQGEAGAIARFARPRLGGGRDRPRPPRVDAPPAADVLRERLEPALISPRAGERLTTARHLEFLRWRYGRFEEYRAVQLGGGLAIFRLWRHGRFWVSRVCELLVAEGDARGARRLVARVSRAAAADAVMCSFPSRVMAARCGFVPIPGGVPLTVRLIDGEVSPDPLRGGSWALSLGDLEVL